MEATQALARGMRRLREDLGMSQADLAEAADLSVQFVAALEQQSRSATLLTVDKLCRGLGVTPAQLFAAGEKRRPAKTAAADQLAHLLQGLTRTQQGVIVSTVKEMRKLVPRKR